METDEVGELLLNRENNNIDDIIFGDSKIVTEFSSLITFLGSKTKLSRGLTPQKG